MVVSMRLQCGSNMTCEYRPLGTGRGCYVISIRPPVVFGGSVFPRAKYVSYLHLETLEGGLTIVETLFHRLEFPSLRSIGGNLVVNENTYLTELNVSSAVVAGSVALNGFYPGAYSVHLGDIKGSIYLTDIRMHLNLRLGTVGGNVSFNHNGFLSEATIQGGPTLGGSLVIESNWVMRLFRVLGFDRIGGSVRVTENKSDWGERHSLLSLPNVTRIGGQLVVQKNGLAGFKIELPKLRSVCEARGARNTIVLQDVQEIECCPSLITTSNCVWPQNLTIATPSEGCEKLKRS